MQVILGAGGAIGKELAINLKTYTDCVRLFGRNPEKVNMDDELVKGDLLNADDVIKAVSGCNVAYLVAGIQYKAEVWELQWPVIMSNVINACKKAGARLVFFDNMYMYNPQKIGHMTEDTEIAPTSRKGKVRALIAGMVMNEFGKEEIEALIARAADFYGPDIKNSLFSEVIVNNLRKGKKANWFISVDKLHNFTYTPDAAKATAFLGNTAEAFNQVWHLPSSEPFTGKQWIEMVANELNVKPGIQVASKTILRIMGLFNSIMKEFIEMAYQYDRDYFFDSSKFEKTFGIGATPALEAIRQITGIK